MKDLNNVKKFSESAPKLYEAFRDYSNHTQANRGILGKEFTKISLDEKEAVIDALFFEEVEKRSGATLAQFDGSAVRYAQNPNVKFYAEDIINSMIDMALPETLINSIGLIAELRFGGYNDVFKFDIENNALFTVSKAGRRQRTAPAQKLYNTTATLTPENHEVTVITNLPAMLSGRESVAKFIMKVVRSIESQMLFEAYDSFYTAMESATLPANLTVANYSENSLITLCQRVTAYNGGRKAVIAGTPVALKTVLPSALGTRISLADDYVKIGHLDNFNGYDIIPMEQVADYTSSDYSLKLKDDRIYVVSPSGDKIIKVAVAGETLSHVDGIYANANLTVEGTLNKAYAVAAITNSIAGVIKL